MHELEGDCILMLMFLMSARREREREIGAEDLLSVEGGEEGRKHTVKLVGARVWIEVDSPHVSPLPGKLIL
jgi:hypothetical protein